MLAFFTVLLLAVAPAVADDQRPAAQTRETGERSADPRDKMICKRFVQTGSLMNGTRVCKTKADWDHDRDNIRAPDTAGTGCGSPSSGHPCPF